MEKTEFEVNKHPYVIREEESGKFIVYSKISAEKDPERNSWSWYYNEDETIGKLEKGLEIIEISARNISLIYRYPKNEFGLPFMFQELKRFASVANCDYVSYELFGNYYSSNIADNGDIRICEVKPRLFRNIVHN